MAIKRTTRKRPLAQRRAAKAARERQAEAKAQTGIRKAIDAIFSFFVREEK